MLSLSEFLVQSPKNLDNGQSGSCNWIREITTRRRDGTDNADSTLTSGRSQTGNTSSTFVEGGQTGTQICGVTGIGRHLSKTTGNLTKGFGPTRCRVSHHGNVHSLITEVFSKGNTSVNRRLTSSDRHVRCVGNQCGTLHDTDLVLLSCTFVLHSHGKFREITKHFSHLVTTFSASNIDNSIRVGEFGKRLRNDSLSTSKGTRDGACSTQHRWKQTVNNTKTSDKRSVTRELFCDGTRATDWPEMTQAKLVSLVLRFVVNFHDNIINQESFLSISSSGVDLAHDTIDIRRTQDLVRVDNFIFVHNTNNISSSDGLPLLEVTRSESPTRFSCQTWDIHTLRHVHITSFHENVLERTLNTIENGSHDTGTEFDGQRLLLTEDGISDSQTRSILVHLNGSGVTFKLDDFSNQLGVSDTDKFVHGRSTHAIGDDQRTRDLKDKAVVGFLFFETHFDEGLVWC
mmetsp:Transcript_3989/g.6287  ORF Transcript_3989/g.6287 Transcript_3989/m.6287 type:complete len:458 (+) Transcript_3989:607-1980(+)